MIRYVSEKQVDLENNLNRKYISHSKQLNKSRIAPEIPQEEINNSSTALKSLKKINDYKEMIKGRVSVLQIQQQKNDFRAFLNQQKYQFHQHMKQEMSKQKAEKALHLKYLLSKLNEAKEKAKSARKIHKNNLQRAKQQIYSGNRNDYIQQKQKSAEIQKSINQFLKQRKEQKKQRCLMIKQVQKVISNNIQQYKKNKKVQFKSKDIGEIEKVNKIKQQRKRQIQQLAQLQRFMIQKQARSKMSSQQSERKLMLLLKGNKNVSTSHTTKLPSINHEEKKQHTDPDVFIV